MKNALIDFYQRELNYLKRRGEAFAEEYPKIAARLQISDDQARDPHVERILQGVAFLNARIRKKLDDEFPELCQTLMDVIYPHFLKPLPSYSIISFKPEDDLTTRSTIKKGTQVEADVDDQFSCRFQTVYDTEVLPAHVSKARLRSYPSDAPNPGQISELESVLHISMRTTNTDVTWEEVAPNKIRFYLKGNRHYGFSLYELIHNHTVKVGVASSTKDRKVVFMEGATAIKSVGFEEDEGVIPYPDQSFIGYRLLTEYFAYPEKFLFFDLMLDDAAKQRLQQHELELYLYFDKSLPDIEATVDEGHFVINATPLINLYDQYSEPTRLTDTDFEYPVVADARHPDYVEVYSVESVSISTDQDEIEYISPFFGISRRGHHPSNARWHTRREEMEFGNTRSQSFLTLTSVDEILEQQGEVIALTALKCFNGQLPKRLSQTQSQPRMVLTSGSSAVGGIRLEIPFSDVIRPRLDDQVYWQLMSHLNLNYVSLTAGQEGTDALRTILSLYNVTRHRESSSIVDAVEIRSVSTGTQRISDDRGMPFFCRGTHIELGLDKTRFAGSSPFLFATVMERFLALYTHLNAYVQVSVILGDDDHPLKVWPPRSGDQVLL
jgi:type VI secretion system protein ImpG